MLPIVTLSSEDYAAGQLTEETLSEATRLFNLHGTLVIKQAFDVNLIQTMHAAFMEHYQRYLTNKRHADALHVGDKRFMVTVALEAPFDNPSLYGNPFVAPILKTLLTRHYLLRGFGAVVSLPGAKAQHVHRDFPGLFPETPIDAMLPCFAITLIVPLIEANETTGTTLVWPQTHRMSLEKAAEVKPEMPILELGDCLLNDFRLVHGGSPNNSDQVRPILYNLYTRPWFQDSANYSKQEPLQISPETLNGVPEEHRHLFVHNVSGNRVSDHT